MAGVAEARVITGSNQGSRLARVVARMAEPDVALPVSRQRRAGDPDRLLITVLREIDETVLPRQITLNVDENASVRLSVANRRLIAVETADGGNAAQDEPGDPLAAARIFTKRLRAVLDGAQRIEFVHARRGDAGGRDAISCSAQSLAKAAGVPLGILGAAAGLDDYLGALKPIALAWLFSAAPGAEDADFGEPDDLAALRAFRDRTRADQKARIQAASPACTVLPLPDGRVLIAATTLGQDLIALAPSTHLKQIVSAWQKRI